jgi:hypothetical protein
MALSTQATGAALALVDQLDALTSLLDAADRSRWSGCMIALREILNREATAAAVKARIAPPAPIPVIPVGRATRLGY